MGTLKITELDIHNENRVKQYEEALYSAFNSDTNNIMSGIWLFDHTTQRARTLVPYQGQKILLAEFDEKIIGAVAANFDMTTQLQVEKYGFIVQKTPEKMAEILLLFSTRVMVGRHVVLVRLAEQCNAMLEDLSIASIWASSDKERLMGYLKIGFRSMGKVHYSGQDEFLLQRIISM